MPRTMNTDAGSKEDLKAALQAAFQRALTFTTNRANDIILGPAQLQERVAEETSFNRVAIDASGLTAGMQLHLVQPARSLLADWRNARSELDRVIQPVKRDIDAVQALEFEVEKEKAKRDEEVGLIEEQLESSRKYIQIRDRYNDAKHRLDGLKASHGLREANMFAYTPLYLVLILMIGAAEWLINYDTFFLFTGIPAIAAGATLILGFLLAFAAHGWGMLLKQWNYRFGQHRSLNDRFANWRLFGLSLFSLLVVLVAAGGSRYSAALHQMSGHVHENILGPDASIEVSPIRDVLISLLANLGAWLLGVFIAYISHDADNEFMDATRQHRAASHAFHRARKSYEGQIKTVMAHYAVELEKKVTAAKTREGTVEFEHNLLKQIMAHEASLVKAVQSALLSNVETYRDLLVKTVIARKGEVILLRTNTDGTEPTSPFEYRSMKISLNEPFYSMAA